MKSGTKRTVECYDFLWNMLAMGILKISYESAGALKNDNFKTPSNTGFEPIVGWSRSCQLWSGLCKNWNFQHVGAMPHMAFLPMSFHWNWGNSEHVEFKALLYVS